MANKIMRWETARKSIDYFVYGKHGGQSVTIFFYGGEPLLNFPLIKKIVIYMEKIKAGYDKKITYAISTNGSLLTDEILRFLDQYHFSIEISFDGKGQDLTRKKGTYEPTLNLIKQVTKYRNITLMVNSVFTSRTISLLAESIQQILDLGVPHINASISLTRRWNKPSIKKVAQQYEQLRRMAENHHKEFDTTPITNFKKNKGKGIWFCPAGQDTLAVTAEGELWGCPLFYEYLKAKPDHDHYTQYFLGNIQDGIKNLEINYKTAVENYRQWRMDNFYTPQRRCFLCPEVEECAMCPVTTTFAGYPLGKIPTYACRINQLHNAEKRKFLQQIETLPVKKKH